MTLKHFIYFVIGALFPLLSFAQEEEGTPNGKEGGVTFKSLSFFFLGRRDLRGA